MKLKIKFKIQSFSNIITNSSSELFAVIKDSTQLTEIQNILDNLFGWRQESEIDMCTYRYKKPTQEDLNGYEWWSWLRKDDSKPKDFPEEWIEIEMPYGLSDYKTFYKTGLEALLKEKFGNNFTIEYYE